MLVRNGCRITTPGVLEFVSRRFDDDSRRSWSLSTSPPVNMMETNGSAGRWSNDRESFGKARCFDDCWWPSIAAEGHPRR